ncbi:hypothetical protein ACTWP5_10555 [Streptomyces sp. 4N509B]|uniref:hypothetical protein n=1 Tax=Streptomyces sp. 4N509B TaxID=3457413 RepID=UPI003FD68025
MSRGHGRVERAILAAAPPYPGDPAITRWSLAQQIYGVDVPTRAQRASVDRAVNNLKHQGLAADGRPDVVVHAGPWKLRYTYGSPDYYRCKEAACYFCQHAIDPATARKPGDVSWGGGPVDERGRHLAYWSRDIRAPRVTQPPNEEEREEMRVSYAEMVAEARGLRGVS